MNNTETLLIDSNRGVYIPQNFAENFCITKSEKPDADGTFWLGITDDDITYLRLGPEEEHYWDVWDEVLKKAYFIDDKGTRWTLHQDSDLFAVSEHHTWRYRDET